jgi:organic hydroperoxide reductase OsmC/OhrA
MDIHYSIDLEWDMSDGAKSMTTPAGTIACFGPGPTHAGGKGPSAEALLLAAISTSYTVTLSHVLRASSLPRTRVSVKADGVIASCRGRLQFTRVKVSPTIGGADVLRRQAYEKAAVAARDGCPIGRSIRGNVAYVVGDVALVRSGTQQTEAVLLR